MTQTYGLVEQTVAALNLIKNIDNTRNIGQYDSKLWWTEFDESTETLNVKSCPNNDLNNTPTTEHSYISPRVGNGVSVVQSLVMRINDDDIVSVVSYVDNNVGSYSAVVFVSYSLNGGSTWTDAELQYIGVSNPLYANRALDCFKLNSTWYYLREAGGGGGNILELGGADFVNYHTGVAIFNKIYLGIVLNNEYFFVYENDSAEYIICRVFEDAGNIDAQTYETLSGISPPSSFNSKQQFYTNNGIFESIVDQDHFYVRRVGESVWASYTGNGESVSGIIWLNNATSYQYEINCICWKDALYYTLESDIFARIIDLSAYNAIYCGYNLFVIDSGDSKVYKIDLVNYESEIISTAQKPYTPHDLALISITQPITNQYLMLFNDNDEIFYQGKIESYVFDFAKYTYKMRSPIEEDYNQNVDVMLASYTGHAALKYLIDTYCKYIWYDTNISTTPTTTYDWDFKNMNVLACIQYIDQRCGYQTIIRPSLEAYWDQGTNSTISIDGDTDSIELPNNAYKKVPLKLSLIILKGAWDATHDNFYKVELLGEPNFGTYIDEYPNLGGVVNPTTGLVTSGPLYDMTTSILALRNKEVITIHLTVAGKGIFYVGQYVTLTLSQYNITAETYYIMGLTYDPDDDVTDLLLSDSLIIQPPNKNSYGAETPATQLETLRWNLESIRYHLQNLYEITNSITSPLNYWLGNTTLEPSLTDSSTALTETATTDPDTLSNIFFKSAVANTPTPFVIPSGSLINIHFNAKQTTTTGAKTVQLYCQIGYVDADGTSNFVQIGANTESSPILTTTITKYELHLHISSDTIVPSGKRLWIKVVADLGGAGNNPEINVYYNDNDSHCQINTYSTFANFLPLAGGTMSGAIAMGTNKITGAGDPTATQDVATKAYVDNYSKCCFLVSSSVAISMASGADTLVTFNTEYDANGDFDIVNDKFVVPVNGYYRFSAMVALASTAWIATKIMQLELYIDGAATYSGERKVCEANCTKVVSACLSIGVNLTAGQEVKLYVYQDNGGAINTVASTRYCYFSGELVYRA